VNSRATKPAKKGKTAAPQLEATTEPKNTQKHAA